MIERSIIEPGATIGILGGGQLGRMLGLAAAQLGYRTHVFAPEATGPATEVAADWTVGAFEDRAAIAAFAAQVDVATYEFENVDPDAVSYLAGLVPVHPPAKSLAMSRYRPREKELATAMGGTTARWQGVDSLEGLEAALAAIGSPAILKTTLFGYDGKGQARIDDPAEADAAWHAIGSPPPLTDAHPAILEARVAFACEFSVLVCRAQDGEMVVWDTPVNVHKAGVLDTAAVPAPPLVLAQAPQAIALAQAIAEALGHVGVLACEFFATADGPVFNEMAPRVHNSGHWTIEGAQCSQFENHIRAICGLPLGATALTGARATMENLVGDDPWQHALSEPGAHLHLYGKREVRAGRKMGHITRITR